MFSSGKRNNRLKKWLLCSAERAVVLVAVMGMTKVVMGGGTGWSETP